MAAIYAVCPGITDTRGMNWGRDVEESARGIVWAATLDDNGSTGTYSRDGQILPW